LRASDESERATISTTTLVPILGARTLAQLDDNLCVLGLTLAADQFARLDAVSEVAAGFPHELLGSERFGAMIRGGVDIDGPARTVA